MGLTDILLSILSIYGGFILALLITSIGDSVKIDKLDKRIKKLEQGGNIQDGYKHIFKK